MDRNHQIVPGEWGVGGVYPGEIKTVILVFKYLKGCFVERRDLLWRLKEGAR